MNTRERLKQLRLEKGLSQAKLAQRADLHPATLSQIETGARQPSIGSIYKLATALRVDAGELIGYEATTYDIKVKYLDVIRDALQNARKELDKGNIENAQQFLDIVASGIDNEIEFAKETRQLKGGVVDDEDAQLAEHGEQLENALREIQASAS